MLEFSGRALGIGLLLAIAVGIAATLVSGELCTHGDDDGCEDEPKQERRDILRYDGDWYGWPVPWRTDMSAAGIDLNEWDESLLMVTSDGVSSPLLLAGVAVWTIIALAAEAVLFVCIRHLPGRRPRIAGGGATPFS